RLEIKFVACVVICGNGLRVRVDHDGFESEFAQSERGVHAAIIKLNSLADSVWSAAEDHHFALLAISSFVLVTVGRVVIRRVSFKLRRAGIDQAISWQNARRLSLRTDFN